MNISVTKLIILLALLPTMIFSQNLENHLVGMDQTLHLEYVSQLIPLSVSDGPDFGTYVLTSEPYGQSPTGLYKLDYTPNLGYLGPDTIKVLLQAPAPYYNLMQLTIAIQVVPAFVKAVDDFMVMTPGSTSNYDVLANDYGTSTPYMEVVSLSNNIQVQIVGNVVEVVSEPVYEGIAQFSYTTCVEPEVCDIGIVSVFINNAGDLVDTVFLGTNRETAKKGLVPLDNGFSMINAPSFGVVENFIEGALDYMPQVNFTGVDTFTIAYNTNSANVSLRTFIIDVFDTDAPNSFAVADEAEVGLAGTVNIDVLDNDLAADSYVHSINQSPDHGTATILADGTVEYVADAGFTGLDHFKYKTCTLQFDCEVTDVYVHVDNQTPEKDLYILTTPMDNPVVLDYPANLSNWDFVLASNTSLNGGNMEYHPGQWSGQVDGQDVSGFNLIVYTPPANWNGDDEFSVDYCYMGDCENVDLIVRVIPDPNTNVDPHCITECVWPGDADGNGVVDIKDALTVGYCTGEVGPARSNPETQWYGQHAADWQMNIPGSTQNLKHIDTDGDGTITAMDTLSIAYNYGLNSNITIEPNAVISNVPIYFVSQTPNPQPGDHVTVNILLGAEPTPAIDVSGVSFTLNYNTDIVEPGTFNVTFAKDSWLSYDAPVMDMVVTPTNGKLDAAYTRVAGTMASGYGLIGSVDFIIEDDIDGIRQGKSLSFTLGVSESNAMNGNGSYSILQGEDLVIEIVQEDNSTDALDPADLALYPNPTYEFLNVHINGKNNFRTIEVLDITGRRHFIVEDNTDHALINVSMMEEGIYFLRAITDKGIVTKKFEVFSRR